MAFYLFRGSTPQVVIPANALLSPKHFVGWSPTNTALAVGTSGNLSLRDPRTGRILRQWKGGELQAWSPDGSALLMHCLPDVQRLGEWALQIRDAQTGELRCAYDGVCGGHVYALAWSPDGTRIAHSTDLDSEGQVHIWDAHTGTSLVEYRGHQQSHYVEKLAWSPDSTLLVSCDNRLPREGTTQLWQSADGTLARQYSSAELWRGSSREGLVRTVKRAIAMIKAAAPTPFATFWEAFTQQYLTDPRSCALLLCGAWSPDGQHLALIDGDWIALLNWQTGKQERRYGGHFREKPYVRFFATPYGPRSLSWSPDGKRIASIDVEGRVHIWLVSVPFPWLPWPKAPVQEWK
jgi:WD40 repeat protein